MYENNPQGQAEYDALVNAIAAAHSDSEAAKSQLQLAWSSGDFAGAADAQERMSRAQAQLTQLESGRQAMDDNEAQPRARVPTAQEIIGSLNLMPGEQEWAKKLHPDWITTPQGRNLLSAAFTLTERDGYKRDAPEFFAQMEERLRLPSSRDYGLNKAQLEHAKWSNVSPETYAENARKLAHLKSLGYYRDQ